MGNEWLSEQENVWPNRSKNQESITKHPETNWKQSIHSLFYKQICVYVSPMCLYSLIL